jgi:hypothetical protein
MARWHLNGSGTSADTIWIGQRRRSREGRAPWTLE